MSDARTIHIDPKDYRLDGRLMRRIWRLLTPYWSQKKHWKSWALMIFNVLTAPLWAWYTFWATQVHAEQANALVVRDADRWYSIFWMLFMLGLGSWVYGIVMNVLETLMRVHYYRWMTEWMVSRYLRNKTYYDIAMKDDIDNPDERIQTYVEGFIDAMLGIPGRIIGTILGVVTQAILLTQVSKDMTLFVVIYSVASMLLQTAINWPLIRKQFESVAAHADFRFGLLRVRDNAETIAFFRGENMEEQQVQNRLQRVIKNRMEIFYYNLKTGVVTKFFGDIWSIAPLFLIYPLYFNKQIEYGTIALAIGAAYQLRQSLSVLDSYIPFLTSLAPGVVRLAQIVERFDQMDERAAAGAGKITIERGDFIQMEEVSFQTPGGEQHLSRDVSLTIRPGESLIIIGQTGVGKSSMLRSMAGLWTRGTGRMVMPSEDAMMFVPQKPYMMLGNLRAQLLYPRGPADMSDADLQAVLEKVCLPKLAEEHGGLAADKDWSRVLSLGEQQRISFARIIISRPKFVFLDESTSAVDIPTEARLYQALIETGATFVSVGHRETILRFHDRALRLLVGGGWEIVDSRHIEPTLVQPLGAARTVRDAEREENSSSRQIIPGMTVPESPPGHS